MHNSLLDRLLREPLLHFLVIGAAIFFLYNQVGTPIEKDNRIVINKTILEMLATDWIRRTGRPPTSQQREQQLKQYIREQVLSREAKTLGLDQNDIIIRRRLTQKMQFLFDDLNSIPEPTDAELVAFISNHKERFIVPATLSFTHVFLDTDKRGKAIQHQAKQLLSQLQESAVAVDTSVLGDQTLLPHQFDNETKKQLSNLLGDEFTEKIYTLPVNQWAGPVASGYGLHLVYVSSRTEAKLPLLAEIRESVSSEWRTVKQREANDIFYQSIHQRYEIILDDDIAEGVIAKTGQ